MQNRLGIAAYGGSFNENGEFNIESSGAIETQMSQKELEEMMFEVGTFEQAYELLMESGASCYISINSNVITYPAEKGTILFVKNGNEQQKIVLDQELTAEIAMQIQDAENLNEIEEILISNNLIKQPEKETEKEFINENESVVDKADNISDRDVTDGGAIAKNRSVNANDSRRRIEIEGFDR